MDTILMAAAQPHPPDESVARGVVLIAILGAVLFGLVFAAAIATALRRARRAREAAKPPRSAQDAPARGDAWAEAGHRVHPEDGDHWLEDTKKP